MENSSLRDGAFEALISALPGRVSVNVELAPLVRWRIGGRAAVLVEPHSAEDVAIVHCIMAKRPEPLFVMGDASNLLFDTAGFDGVVMRIGRAMSMFSIEENRVKAEAGVWIPQLTLAAARAGLSGLEHTIGIPGTLGGLVLMNGGSQRKGIGLNIVEVQCVDNMGENFVLQRDDCGFAYRQSVLQTMPITVVGAQLELVPGIRSKILREMIEIMVSRRSRFPKKLPNGGSTFLSDPALYATLGPPGKVIESLGFKGLTRGGAQVSPQHANFIVNNGGATSEDILWIINEIRLATFKETGIWMDTEVRHVSFDGKVRPAHVAAAERFAIR